MLIRSVAIGVILTLTSSASIASALDSPQCCACVDMQMAQPGGATNHSAGSLALFCVSSSNNQTVSAAGDRCHDLTGGLLLCVADGGNSCHDDLASIGITCPATGAPTAGGASLLALAVVLGAGGALFLRRNAMEHRR